MALKVVNQGEEAMLELILAETYELCLFSNDVTPADTHTEADYTIVSGGGYTDKTLTGGAWTITPGAPAVGTYAEQTFAFTGSPSAPNVYGYIVRKASDNALRWAERFAAGPYSPGNLDEIHVTPRLTLKDESD